MNKKVIPFLILASFFGGIIFLWTWQNREPIIKLISRGSVSVETLPPEQEQTATQSPEENQLSFSVSPPEENQATPSPFPTLAVSVSWSTYVNQKYNYQFQYDSGWFFNSHPPGSEENDRIILQGNIQEKGWPNIGINLQYFDPQPNTINELAEKIENTFGSWGTVGITTFGNSIPAVLHDSPASPQAYASWSYYFIHNNQVFQIHMTDSDKPEGQTIYQEFLNNFELF